MESTKIDTLILSGGGFRGLIYPGIFKYLHELQCGNNKKYQNKFEINIKNISAVSVGSLFGLLYILKYDWRELRDEIFNKNFKHLKNIDYKNFLTNYGIDSCKYVVEWIESLIIKKNISKTITFKELYDITGIHFRVFVTNLNKYTQEYFDYLNQPDMQVILGIKASMSIPLVITHEKINDNIYVDGAVIDNYPIEFHEELNGTLENVVGINLINYFEVGNEIDSVWSYMYNVIFCMIYQMNKIQIKEKYKKYTIPIQFNSSESMLNFKMTKKQKLDLIKLGYFSANEYFSNYFLNYLSN